MLMKGPNLSPGKKRTHIFTHTVEWILAASQRSGVLVFDKSAGFRTNFKHRRLRGWESLRGIRAKYVTGRHGFETIFSSRNQFFLFNPRILDFAVSRSLLGC